MAVLRPFLLGQSGRRRRMWRKYYTSANFLLVIFSARSNFQKVLGFLLNPRGVEVLPQLRLFQ
jgi:hypothetical protein